jgi:hypothetical protein
MRFGRLCEGATYKLTGTAISKDGKTMTLASKGTNAEGKPFESTMVYDRK